MIPLDTPIGTVVRLNLPVEEVEKFRANYEKFSTVLGLDGSVVQVHGSKGNLLVISGRRGPRVVVEPAWLYPTSGDDELDLLNRLAAEVPQELYRQINGSWTDLPAAYVDRPDTVCSIRNERTAGQSSLGFLNQCRKARGLPGITMHSETDVQDRLVRLWFSSEVR